MNGTSSGSDLQARLQKRAELDREQIEEVVQSQLNELSKNLKNIINCELDTIENDTKIWIKRLRSAALKAWARPIMVGLLLFLGICGGKLGPDAVVLQPDPKSHREKGRINAPARAGADTARSAPGADVGCVAPRGGGWGEVRSASQGDPHAFFVKLSHSGDVVMCEAQQSVDAEP